MSLMERNYMADRYNKKIIEKNKLKDEMWKLYSKKQLTIIDKIKLKKIHKKLSQMY